MYHNSKIKMAVTVTLCICMCVWSRFQRKVAAQPVEAGDQQSCDVWPAHPVSYVHKQIRQNAWEEVQRRLLR